MGLKLDEVGNIITTQSTDDTIRQSDGTKINKKRYVLSITSDGQTSITLPFTYITGDPFEVYLNDYLTRDYTVSGATLTWVGADGDLETSDTLEIVG